ncbi:MAG: hypothetical protein ABIT37_08900 [Luteolibacter sp.]
MFPPESTPEETIWESSGAADAAAAPMQLNFNQQINFFGEIQGFDNLEKLSPETRTAALQYLEKEQAARHQYVSMDQRHQQSLQTKGQTIAAKIQSQAMILACSVFVVTLVIAAFLLLNGQTGAAIGLVFGEAAVAVGMVVYGNSISGKKSNDSQTAENDSEEK